MPKNLYDLGGLPFWDESEIDLRESFQQLVASTMRRALQTKMPVIRCEGPVLHPRHVISEAYDDNDIFVTNHKALGGPLVLRPETTASSYAYARYWLKRQQTTIPLCVWQAGLSHRRETNDGATAEKLRFNSFWQQEFQTIVPLETKRKDGELRKKLMAAIIPEIERFTRLETRIVDSDRLPNYSESTKDIECWWRGGWKEVASCSLRNDFSAETRVVEIAIGLCRIATMAGDITK